MPELPDITVYIDSLAKRILGEPTLGIRLKSMFLLRTFEPRPVEVVGKRVRGIRRIGKQHIVYADNETNYCATCQTGGKLLADRSLSKLMKADWPKTLAELEGRKRNKP